MKNLPARERPARRVHGKWAQHGKEEHKYGTLAGPLKVGVLRELLAARESAFGPGYTGGKAGGPQSAERDRELLASAEAREGRGGRGA